MRTVFSRPTGRSTHPTANVVSAAKRSLLLLVFLSAVTAPLAACGPGTMLLGAGARAGVAATEYRGVDGTLSDAGLQVEVNNAWLNHATDSFWDLSTLVRNGRVLVVGNVATEADRAEAIALAAAVEGVAEVIDELTVGGDPGFLDTAQDTVITSRMESKLLFDNEIKAVNFGILTHNAIIYIMGQARSSWEAERVIAHARNVPYVREVVSHATVAAQ